MSKAWRDLRDRAKEPRDQLICALACLLALFCIALYLNGVIGGKFLWDDEQFVYRNLYLSSWRYLPQLLSTSITQGAGIRSNLYRPIQALTHFVDVRVWGLNPVGHRLTNLLLDVLAMVSIYFMVLRFLDRKTPLAAFLAVSLYAAHPLQSFAASYISGRGDLLVMIFAAWSVLAFDRCFPLSLIFAGLGMLSKENGILIPVLALAYDWVQSRRSSEHRLRLGKLATMGALAMAYVLARLSWLDFGDTLNFYGSTNLFVAHPSYRLFTYFSTFAKGMQILLFPIGIHHERSWPVYASFLEWPVVLGALMIAVIAWGAFRLRNRAPITAVGLAWLVAATLPTSNLIAIINALIYDHWFLLPGLGLCLIAADRARSWLESPRARSRAAYGAMIALWLAMLIPLSAGAFEQNEAWKSPISLYQRILAYEPRSSKIMNNLAMEYAAQGKRAAAQALYERAIRTQDTFFQSHHNLGTLYLEEGKVNDAMAQFDRALELDPDSYMTLAYKGIALLKLGQPEKAIPWFLRSISRHPCVQAYQGIIQAYRDTGRPELARRYGLEGRKIFRSN